jgi:hypothetical protein
MEMGLVDVDVVVAISQKNLSFGRGSIKAFG